ncbi:MAG: substrate-binding protein [Chloroflexia bacterium]|nr:substrate-binding protein [Chloroflexia bacterium]
MAQSSRQLRRIMRATFDRRALLRGAAAAGAVPLAGTFRARGAVAQNTDPIRVGAIIPFTGLETHNGLSMQYGLEIATGEINTAGGLAGRQVEVIMEDDGSDVGRGVRAAAKLVGQDAVEFLNGTLTSSVRTAVFEETRESQTLFLNPTYYEGGLCDPYYFSSGATPNQGIEPMTAFAMENLGKSFYFVASDYIWGTGSVAAAIPAVEAGGGSVVGEEYVPFGTSDFTAVINRIKEAAPDVVFPFVAGQDGITFLKQLSDFGVRENVEICADSIDELIVPALSNEVAAGIVNCSCYYMMLENDANQAFLETMRSTYGDDALIGSFGMNMYNNMKLVQAAADGLDEWTKDAITERLREATFDGPSGPLTTDPSNQHMVQNAYIATIQPDKSFKLEETIENVSPQAGCTVP